MRVFGGGVEPQYTYLISWLLEHFSVAEFSQFQDGPAEPIFFHHLRASSNQNGRLGAWLQETFFVGLLITDMSAKLHGVKPNWRAELSKLRVVIVRKYIFLNCTDANMTVKWHFVNFFCGSTHDGHACQISCFKEQLASGAEDSK